MIPLYLIWSFGGKLFNSGALTVIVLANSRLRIDLRSLEDWQKNDMNLAFIGKFRIETNWKIQVVLYLLIKCR